MANGKSQITDIDIKSVSVNLTDYLDDIRPYEGFIQCNSPYIGGLLNNVYKRKIQLPNGHKLVRMHNGNMYTIVGGTLYKNGLEIANVSTDSFYKEAYTDPIVQETGDSMLTIKYGGVTIQKKYLLNYNYCYDFSDTTLRITIAPATASSWAEFEKGLAYTTITSGGTVTNWTGDQASIVTLQGVVSMSSLKSNTTSTAVHIQYDASGVIVESSTDIYSMCSTPSVRNTVKYNHVENICKGAGVSYWIRGEKLFTPGGFDTLYYRKFISGISYNNSVVTYDVDKILGGDSNSIIYADPSGSKWKLTVYHNATAQYTVDDDYIYFNTTSYENTYSFKEDKIFCRSDDYNDRVLLTGPTGNNGLYVSAYKCNAQVMNYSGFATVYPEVENQLGSTYKKLELEDLDNHPIEIFSPNTAGGVAYYKHSITFVEGTSDVYDTFQESSLDGTMYPISTDGNTLYNTPILMDISDTYINEKIGSIGNYSYILAKSQRQENICGYYEYTLSEISKIFITQGSFYGITDRYIFDLSVVNSQLQINRVVANKLDLVFLGAFPNTALFYSKLDKSIYAFTGDAILTKLKEAYRINEIYSTYCDPSRLTMLIATDIGTLVFYQDQTFLLDYVHTKDEIYYDYNTYIIGDTFLSLSYKPDYDIAPITLQTEYYGLGSNVKSINDCVYVRLAKNGIGKGYLKITSYCLNEKTVESKTKTIDIIDSMFDKVTESFFVRYQPQNQSASGFSVKLETTNPIISLSIGHNAEAVQNARINF
jgi:hypothetical protein